MNILLSITLIWAFFLTCKLTINGVFSDALLILKLSTNLPGGVLHKLSNYWRILKTKINLKNFKFYFNGFQLTI